MSDSYRYIIERPGGESSRGARQVDDDAAEGRSDDRGDSRNNKRQKTKTGWKARQAGKARPTGEAAVRICKAWETTGECSRGDACKYAHSWAGYFEVKPKDTHYEAKAGFFEEEPFVRSTASPLVGGEDVIGKTLDLTTECPVYADLGYCPFAWRCRYLGGHIRKVTEAGPDSVTRLGEWELATKSEATEPGNKHNEVNWPSSEMLSQLKNNKYAWRFSPVYLHHVEPEKPFALAMPKGSFKKGKGGKVQAVQLSEEDAMNGAEEAAVNEEEEAANAEPKGLVPGEAEAMDVPLRPEEKRRLNWENGLYLAPLTTVGNLVGHRSASQANLPALPSLVYRLRRDHYRLRDGARPAARHRPD